MDLRRTIGACLPMFLIAVIFDITGIILLFLGIFANLRINGLFYGDFLIYTGSIILFFSLGLWLMWYLGNVPAPYDPLTKSNSLVELARKISRRLSEKLKTEVMGKQAGDGDETSHEDAKPSGRVTWGKSTAYVNKGYEQDGEETVDRDQEDGEDTKSHQYNDTAVDGDESDDMKKHIDEDEEDVKVNTAEKPLEESADDVDTTTGDTQETSFDL